MKLIDDCDSVLGIYTNLNLLTNKSYRTLDISMPELKNIDDCPKELDLVIIGGGLAGITLASRAWHLGYNKNNMAVLDANTYLAENFVTRTKMINQKLMRSPYKHHLAPVEDLSLSNFARLKHHMLNKDEAKQLNLDRLGERALPPLDIFLSHTKEVIHTHGLSNLAYKINVEELFKLDGSWIIKDRDNNSIKAKYVILALGNDVNTYDLHQSITIPTVSALTTDYHTYCQKGISTICVVGSGNTAAHVIINAIQSGKKVNWILRNEEYYRCADIPNEFWRYEGLTQFSKLSLRLRHEKLNKIYHGSATPENFYLFRKLKKRGLLKVYEFDKIDKQFKHNSLRLKSGKIINAEVIVMATGLKPNNLPVISPNILWYENLPVLNDKTLEAQGASNLFIASSHSALSLGPASKNIDGMRLANERIFKSILKKENKWISDVSKIRKISKWGTSGAITG